MTNDSRSDASEGDDLSGRKGRWLGLGKSKVEKEDEPTDGREWRDYRDLKKINQALLPLLAVGIVAILMLGIGWKLLAALLLWSMACLAVGGLLGFVFGIPRAMSPAERGATKEEDTTSTATPGKGQTWRANTNLEEVSDWLTKIIVGLSLVHLHEIETRLHTVSRMVAASIAEPQFPALGNAAAKGAAAVASVASGAQGTASAAAAAQAAAAAASGASSAVLVAQEAASAASAAAATCLKACAPSDAAVSVAMALVVCMTVVGFLLGYLYTRLFLPAAFGRSERDAADQFKRRLRSAQAVSLKSPQPSEGQPVVATMQDKALAQNVAQAGQPDLALRELLKLCAEYDQLRNDMPVFSKTRTKKMIDIVSRMKPLTTTTRGVLDSLTNSSLPGERLAATVMLLMQFDPTYIDWLAARLADESSFIGYQAASALLARMSSPLADAAERQRITAAVQAARDRMPGQKDKSLEALIDSILGTGSGT